MKILGLEFQNFNSYGNNITKIDFEDEATLTMLIGQSGHGKSSIREVISYLIYGKVPDKKLGDLPNRINNSLWGKIHLSVPNNTITIERGMKPNVFIVTINNEIFDTNGKGNVQDILETEYLKIPQATFDNVISISVDKFKSFLVMRPQDKRKILDQIFGIVFFNKIFDILKDKVKDFNIEIKNLDGQVNILVENKKQIEEKIKLLDEEQSKHLTEKLAKVIEEMGVLTSKLEVLNSSTKEIENKANLVREKSSEITKLKSANSHEINTCSQKIELYENDKCPECSSNLQTSEHQEIKTQLLQKREELRAKQAEYINKLVKVKQINSEIAQSKKNMSDEIFDIKILISNLQSEKVNINKKQQDESENDFTDVLTNTLTRIDEILSKIAEIKQDEYLYTELSKMFGEDGIKLQIMRNFLPSFNKSINEFSRKLHFPYQIEIDEKFNSRITSIGEEINPKTLSTGERKKADFAVLISLIKIMKRNYPNINLLFLDEILASIDSYGVFEMLSLIRDVVDELNLNVFVINHSELPTELFDNIYSVNKVAGFSELEKKSC